ncbi:hypothetical protein ACH37Y_04555 [Sphingomonas paucimobilis]|uniref:hypothetical protein n=1 Tax=Sphingomonas paucimobilis TaxID=13689 RepID=UPI00378E2B0A
MMKMTRAAVIGAVTALSVAIAPAMAQKAKGAVRPATSTAWPLAMDVAGVRLGMLLAAAQTALAGTYRCSTYRVASFRQLVEREVRKRKGIPDGFGPDGTAVGDLTCQGPAGEHLRLFMAQTPAGEIIDRIDLTVSTKRIDLATLVAQVEGKYGRPTEGTPANGSWCSTRCGADLTMEPDPRITVMSDASSLKILGSRGRNARLADEAAVKAAAVREAPAAARGAF